MGRTRDRVVVPATWLLVAAPLAVFWWSAVGLAIELVRASEPPVPVSRSQVPESDPEPTLTIIGEGN